jgi:hypothetical protein
VRDRKLTGKMAHGQHLTRDRSSYATPAGRSVTGFEPAGRFTG